MCIHVKFTDIAYLSLCYDQKDKSIMRLLNVNVREAKQLYLKGLSHGIIQSQGSVITFVWVVLPLLSWPFGRLLLHGNFIATTWDVLNPLLTINIKLTTIGALIHKPCPREKLQETKETKVNPYIKINVFYQQ